MLLITIKVPISPTSVIRKNRFEDRKIEEHHHQSWDGGGCESGGGIGAKDYGGGSREAGIGIGAGATIASSIVI